jgi:AAA+ superfamily predicted ATPase
LKRQGRAEEHIALFYPQTDTERDDLFKAMMRKTKVDVEAPSFSALVDGTVGKSFSGADIEAMLVRAKFRALSEGRDKATAEDVKNVLADFVPPSYPLEIELQNLAAVQECTSRELLPEAYRNMGRDVVTRRIREIKALLEER